MLFSSMDFLRKQVLCNHVGCLVWGKSLICYKILSVIWKLEPHKRRWQDVCPSSGNVCNMITYGVNYWNTHMRKRVYECPNHRKIFPGNLKSTTWHRSERSEIILNWGVWGSSFQMSTFPLASAVPIVFDLLCIPERFARILNIQEFSPSKVMDDNICAGLEHSRNYSGTLLSCS